MRINRLHVCLGLILILIVFIGIPSSVRNFIVIVIGAVIAGLGMQSVHKEYRKKHKKHSHMHDAFVESAPVKHEPVMNESSTDDTEVKSNSHIADDQI